MPTEKPRVTITLSSEQLQRIDDFRFENKMKNQTQAILFLVESGLAELEKDIKKAPLYSSEAMKLAQDYDSLDSHGQRMLRLVAEEEKARHAEQEKKQVESEERELARQILQDKKAEGDSPVFNGAAGENKMA